MENRNLPLIGICKNCRRPATGQLVDGKFQCHECLVPRGTSTAANPNTWFYTFTTSNSTGTRQQ